MTSTESKYDAATWAEKIRALLAMAEDQRLDEQLRQTYAAKAAELMTRHGINAAQIRAAAGDTAPETAEIWPHAVPGTNGYGPARARAACLIAEAMGCKAVPQHNPTPRPCMVIIVGVRADLEALHTLLPLVMNQAELAAASAAAQGHRAPSYLAAFVTGYGQAVAERITERRREYASDETGADLVLASRAVAVADLFHATFAEHITHTHTDTQRADATAAGRAAGRRADLGDNRLGPPAPPRSPAADRPCRAHPAPRAHTHGAEHEQRRQPGQPTTTQEGPPVNLVIVTFARRGTEAHASYCASLDTVPYKRPSITRVKHTAESHAELLAAAGLTPQTLRLTCNCVRTLPEHTPTLAERIASARRHLAGILRPPLWPDSPQNRSRIAALSELAAANRDTDTATLTDELTAALDRLHELRERLDPFQSRAEPAPYDLRPPSSGTLP
jgi:hypothetical protein